MTGTFHSICVRILRQYGSQIGFDRSFTICDTDDVKKQIALCMKQLNIDDKNLPVKTVMNAISHAKDKLIGPTEYAMQAVERYGAVYGGYLAARRLLRCHPFAKGGYDPVPERVDTIIRKDEN